MEASAKIKLLRTSQAVNSGRDYEIYLNGEQEGEIANGEEEIIEVRPGEHEIYVKIDWCKSKKMILNLDEDEEVKLICGSKLVGWKQWLTLFYFFTTDKFVYLDYYSQDLTLDYDEETWGEIREKGFLYFIIKEGVIGWGLPVGGLVVLVDILTSLGEITFYEIILEILNTLAIFSIGGIIFGVIMWVLSTREEEKKEISN
ncbi:DUF2846 domain-containing protein [Natroniella sulfidigena]|uniref:DUF2846 domain-containing protein n=1 Tax=Natroniella sulfidigena TaxID=723921 RepID=UPI00200A8535|nr:DUF2846 domain-containing protein [Natroniella sulfidigena]MCK8818032.1 DUF2846 domain-containing protein [Natroniella sulfidigena]